MAYHPFLDWRLGLDLVNLCLDKDYTISLEAPYWTSLVESVQKNLVELIGNGKENGMGRSLRNPCAFGSDRKPEKSVYFTSPTCRL